MNISDPKELERKRIYYERNKNIINARQQVREQEEEWRKLQLLENDEAWEREEMAKINRKFTTPGACEDCNIPEKELGYKIYPHTFPGKNPEVRYLCVDCLNKAYKERARRAQIALGYAPPPEFARPPPRV